MTTSIYTFAHIELIKLGTRLLGYLMSDGTFQFIIKGEMKTYATLLDVWSAYIDI